MATSSILKQFVVKDYEAFERLLREAENVSRADTAQESPSLKKGREALKRVCLVWQKFIIYQLTNSETSHIIEMQGDLRRCAHRA